MMQKNRRAHTKSRNGCLTCKRRRVRCDEIRPTCSNCLRLKLSCAYTQRTAGTEDDQMTIAGTTGDTNLISVLIMEELGFGDPTMSGTPISTYKMCYRPASDVDIPYRDRVLVAFCHRISDDLYFAHAESFFWGTSLLGEFNKIGSTVEYVRFSICCMACTHLSLLAKSTSMTLLAYQYREKAIQGLREALGAVSTGNVDAILAASFVLSWQAPESEEFVQTFKGVNLVLSQMEVMNITSCLRSLFVQPILASEMQLVGGPLPPNNTTRIEQASNALQDFMRVARRDEELLRGLRELHSYLINLQSTPPGYSWDDQYKALYPIRWCLPWLPHLMFNLSRRDMLSVAFTAYFNMIALLADPFFPAARNAFGLRRRAEVIERLYTTELNKHLWPAQTEGLFDTLMQTPLSIAKAYLEAHQ